MLSELRTQYLLVLGRTYDSYGLPQLCGMVEGLLSLTDRPLSQTDISELLKAILGDLDVPTSVPSVNRAMQVLEQYGVVKKTGTRKEGYLYYLVEGSDLIRNMFAQFVEVNDLTIHQLSELRSQVGTDDPSLSQVLGYQVEGYTVFNSLLIRWIAELSSSEGGESK